MRSSISGQMRDHAFDQRLRELAHARRGRTKLPEFVHRFRRVAAVQVAPEMILDARPAARRDVCP